MPDPVIERTIEQSQLLTVQAAEKPDNNMLGRIFIVPWMAGQGQIVSPWWSRVRDMELRAFWPKSDHLSGAIYSFVSKMTAIPNKVVARNTSIKTYVEEAARLTDLLQIAPGMGRGWVREYGKFVHDLVTQDNGAFMEVIGNGEPSGPIVGRPLNVAHLDSSRCTRTGNTEYPVIYEDTNGKWYKLHRSRVMYTSQMTSPIAEMYGVGFCAVSRCVNVAQTLIDITTFKQEKLGSRPPRKIIITKGGLDPSDLKAAISIADSTMDSAGLKYFSRVIIGGSSTMPEAEVREIDLSAMPDGFDENSSITLGMATIALAFGVDARELFPAMSAGATRADALLQHLKQRGKGPGQIIQETENLFNYYFLPPYLRFQFDFQDDAEDRQRAEIRQVRATRRVQDMSTSSMNDHVMREQMYEEGDLSLAQFEYSEMYEGRLIDGMPITALFYSEKGDIVEMLDLGIKDPLDVFKNTPDTILPKIEKQQVEVLRIMANTPSESRRDTAMQAYFALEHLRNMYEEKGEELEQQELQEQQMEIDAQRRTGAPLKPGAPKPNRTEKRVRTQDLTNPAPQQTNPNQRSNDGGDEE